VTRTSKESALAIVPSGTARTIALDIDPNHAITRLRETIRVPVFEAAEARAYRGTAPFAVVEGDVFRVYAPWVNVRTAGLDAGDLSIGPAVEGRVVAAERGARVELRVIPYAPSPSQRVRVQGVGLGLVTLALAIVALAPAHPVAWALAGLILGSVAVSLVVRERRRRATDIRELLSIVEGVYGPLELPAGDESPHRRGEVGSADA
jgi:hypothetical protein